MSYRAKSSPAATAGTIDHAIIELWNPHASRPIILRSLKIVFPAAPAAGAGFYTRRTSAKGTPATTTTLVAAHHHRGLTVPDTGFTIEKAVFSVQPTLVAGELDPMWVFAAAAGSGLIDPVSVPIAMEGIEIPAGQGLAFLNIAAVIFAASHWGFVVDEG